VTDKRQHAWDRVCLDGVELPLRFDSQYEQKPIRHRSVDAPISGRHTASMEMELIEANSDSFKPFQDMVDSFSLAITEVCLGSPDPLFKEKNGRLLRRCHGKVRARIGNTSIENGVMWEDIGSSWESPGDNRLRKFVQRNGQLIEVRTRGRTGHRSLQEAVQAALIQPLSGFTGRFVIDDATTETP
jgi:hypothetical protein